MEYPREFKLEFQCVEIDTVALDGDSSSTTPSSNRSGEPIERDFDELDGGYNIIGGTSKHLAGVRELVELPSESSGALG